MENIYENTAKKLWVAASDEHKQLMCKAWMFDPTIAWVQFRQSFTNAGGTPEEATWIWSSLENLMHKEMEE